MELKQALIITDSIGAPRHLPEKTLYKDTWVSKTENLLLESYQTKSFAYTQRAADSRHVKSRLNVQLDLYNPELVFIQIGICDCAPRALKESELKYIKRIPFINKIVHNYVSKNYSRISEKRNLSYIEPGEFKENMIAIGDSFPKSKIFAIPIGLPNEEYCKKSPRIFERVKIYNEILSEVFNEPNIYLKEFTKATEDKLGDIYMEDNYHLKAIGHDILFETVRNKLDSLGLNK